MDRKAAHAAETVGFSFGGKYSGNGGAGAEVDQPAR
jgi:hypothetical protein